MDSLELLERHAAELRRRALNDARERIPHCDDLLARGRLVRRKLSDGSTFYQVEKTFSAGVLKADAEGRIPVVASDETVDRFGDVIVASGWQLAEFKKNPVYLIDHTYRVAAIAGFGTDTKVEKKKLVDLVQLDDSDTGTMVRQKIDAKSLRTLSVGFRPRKIERILDDDGNIVGFKFLEQELLEVSFVAVPANPNALIGAAVDSSRAPSLDESRDASLDERAADWDRLLRISMHD